MGLGTWKRSASACSAKPSTGIASESDPEGQPDGPIFMPAISPFESTRIGGSGRQAMYRQHRPTRTETGIVERHRPAFSASTASATGSRVSDCPEEIAPRPSGMAGQETKSLESGFAS